MNWLRFVLPLLCFTFYSVIASSQNVAPQIIAEDCDGNTHDLYEELGKGKIIVIGWTMPCGTCAKPLLEVHNVVLEYAISHPGKVEYWLADDFAETSCSTIKEWCSNNGINNAIFFSTKSLDMFDFGSAGMPKVVVVGCDKGTVYYNVDDFPWGGGVDEAIADALEDMDGGCQGLSIAEHDFASEVALFPNPAGTDLNLHFEFKKPQDFVHVKIMNALGQEAMSSSIQENVPLSNQLQLDVQQLEKGLYFVVIQGSDASKTLRFQKQ